MAPIPRSLPLIVQKSWKIRGHPFLLRLPIVHKLCPPPSLLPLLPWPHYPLIFNQYKGSANDMTSRECLSKSLEFDRNVCLVEEKKKVRLILSSWPESKLKEQFFLLFFFSFLFFFLSYPALEMSQKVIEDPPLSCLAGWSEVQTCFSALQVLHFSLSCPPLIVLIEPCGLAAQAALLGSAGLPCAFYLYFMLWRCAQTASRTSSKRKIHRDAQRMSTGQIQLHSSIKSHLLTI